MIFVGVDPGVTGAIAWIQNLPEGKVGVSPMPTVVNPTRGKQSRTLDIPELLRQFKNLNDRAGGCIATVEKISFNPALAFAMATLLESYGSIKTALTAAGIPYETAAAQTWRRFFFKKATKDKKQRKALSILKAKELFPMVDFSAFNKEYHDGLAEALLICEYGRRTYKKGG